MHNVAASKNRIKELSKLKQKKYRDETGLFLVEGKKALDGILDCGIEIVDVFSLKELNYINAIIVDEDTMKKLSSTDSVCDVLTVAKKRKVDINKFSQLNTIILLDSISDPGNLGTIIRSAAAFGIDGIILYGNCTDIYSPKVIRSTAGNLFKIPILQVNSLNEFDKHIKIATILSQENNISIKECAKLEKKIIMFGSEAKGLSKELIDISEKNIRLNMKNNVESLNLAVCASIIFYELCN